MYTPNKQLQIEAPCSKTSASSVESLRGMRSLLDSSLVPNGPLTAYWTVEVK
jgi:hypothetical protein